MATASQTRLAWLTEAPTIRAPRLDDYSRKLHDSVTMTRAARHIARQAVHGIQYLLGDADLDLLAASRARGGLPGGSAGGGMIMGPDHPMFRPHDDFSGPNLYGGPQFLPPGSVPPGSRFDQIGPFGARAPPPFPSRNRNFPDGGPDPNSGYGFFIFLSNFSKRRN